MYKPREGVEMRISSLAEALSQLELTERDLLADLDPGMLAWAP